MDGGTRFFKMAAPEAGRGRSQAAPPPGAAILKKRVPPFMLPPSWIPESSDENVAIIVR